jgi:ssDNA-binding Zn-finger/Zn-ribbon topoisomerase 1
MSGIRTEPKPYCPDCGAQMRLRRPRTGQNWKAFWGCSQYPECRGIRNIDENGDPESDDMYWCDWCGEYPSLPGVPCRQCMVLGVEE